MDNLFLDTIVTYVNIIYSVFPIVLFLITIMIIIIFYAKKK